ncbi:MAG: 2-succinyl-5-enolpyruvyl-6-hydroxy-3-cyclohexene-1-carboxylic-acid synthase [Polyangia bacterium]
MTLTPTATPTAIRDGLATAQTEWARLLLGSLRQAGVRDVVLSPGSRSTPLVCAAAATPELVLWDVIDERAAAFFALGQARVLGRPSLLVCTSGSAGAHYFPAVLEAEQAGVPLLVLTADRPPELQRCGAPQTIDQLKLFGDHVRAFFELGTADVSEGSLRALRRVGALAVLAATTGPPGPVHLNVRLRKPLEPVAPSTEAEVALHARVDGLLAAPPIAIRPPLRLPDPAAVAEVAARCHEKARGLIVCGPLPLGARALRPLLVELAELTGFPLLCEATSQARFGLPREAARCDHFDALLRGGVGLGAPGTVELILHLGAPATSGALERFLSQRPELPRILLGGHAPLDPHATAEHVLLGDEALCLRALIDALRGRGAGAPATWSAHVAALDALAAGALQAALQAAGLSEPLAVRTVVEEVPPGSLLVIGNSLPVREVDLFGHAAVGDKELGVLSQRGVNGIDGLLAGAAGAASVSERPVTLLLGDVSLLHDLGSLQLVRHARAPLTVVVINNQGGRIFEQLPLAQSPAVGADATDGGGGDGAGLMARFTTPHSHALAEIARALGWSALRVEDEVTLRQALRRRPDRGLLIEVRVPPHSSLELLGAYHRGLAGALAACTGAGP